MRDDSPGASLEPLAAIVRRNRCGLFAPHRGAPPWHYLVLTAASEAQARLYRDELAARRARGLIPRSTRVLAVPDPPGPTSWGVGERWPTSCRRPLPRACAEPEPLTRLAASPFPAASPTTRASPPLLPAQPSSAARSPTLRERRIPQAAVWLDVAHAERSLWNAKLFPFAPGDDVQQALDLALWMQEAHPPPKAVRAWRAVPRFALADLASLCGAGGPPVNAS